MTRAKKRRLVAAIAVASIALVGGGLYAALSNSGAGSGNALVDQSERPAPQFSLPEIGSSSKSISLADVRGHDVVVNFWASWCIPCRTEMPLLQSAFVSERGRVIFVGIDTNDTRDSALAFLRQVKVTYPTAFDPDGQVASTYGLFGLPVTVFISSQGKMVGRHLGQFDSATLGAALREAFGALPGS